MIVNYIYYLANQARCLLPIRLLIEIYTVYVSILYIEIPCNKLALEIEWAYRQEDLANSTEQTVQQTNAQVQLLPKNAKAQLGVPYKWAGTDPSGFDCSGFTSYVFEQAAIQIPRRAVEQYTYCKPVAPTEACAGGLVFFSNGGEVNHVGLLISAKGAPKQMIHASSSIGISIVDVDASAYWSARIVGYGRVPKN